MTQENGQITNFEDLLNFSDRNIQMVLRKLEMDELSLCLKGSSPQLFDKFCANMSERACKMLKEQMNASGPVKLSDVEEAQMRVVDIARNL